jgi:hypothetical protein
MCAAIAGDWRANAHPTKAFFVRMLIRDISLEDCILDLIDNSIDAAWRSVTAEPTTLKVSTELSKFRIDLEIDSEHFAISDNCGGITLDDAVNYAFTFGREGTSSSDDYTIGVYGIGMKRAVFKLGNEVAVTSSPREGESFVVPINVDDWMTDHADEWDFDIDESSPLAEPGVAIRVQGLKPETSATFDDPGFVTSLTEIVSRDYMLPLMRGLQIAINGKLVTGWSLDFRSSRDFVPMRDRYAEGEVLVEIIAGMVSSPPVSSDPPARNSDKRSGWFVICNGRVVVAADRTPLTVWGRDKFNAWHPQYSGFVGVVLFSSKHPELLPMTTTKNSIDAGAGVYRRVLSRMMEPTRAWIEYTNTRKAQPPEDRRQREEATKPLPIQSVKDRKKVKLPEASGMRGEANVLYTVSVDRMRRLAQAFGRSTMSYREVGTRSFDFAYSHLVDEDDA